MKKIIFVLMGGLVLSGCTLNQDSTQKDKEISELKQQVEMLKKEKEDDLFKKKQECAKYKEEIEIENGITKDNYYEISLLSLFYSEKLNTCLYEIYSNYELDNGKCSEYGATININDYFSKKIIDEKVGCRDFDNIYNILPYNNGDSIYLTKFNNYDNVLKELKGE